MLFDKRFFLKYLLHTHIYTHTTILIHFFNSSNISHIYTHTHTHTYINILMY